MTGGPEDESTLIQDAESPTTLPVDTHVHILHQGQTYIYV